MTLSAWTSGELSGRQGRRAQGAECQLKRTRHARFICVADRSKSSGMANRETTRVDNNVQSGLRTRIVNELLTDRVDDHRRRDGHIRSLCRILKD